MRAWEYMRASIKTRPQPFQSTTFTNEKKKNQRHNRKRHGRRIAIDTSQKIEVNETFPPSKHAANYQTAF